MFHDESLSVMLRTAGARFFRWFVGPPAPVFRRPLLLRPGSMPPMSAVPVKQVHQKAREQQNKGQVLKDMRPVLGEEKKCGDEDESPEYPTAKPAVRSALVVGVIVRHIRFSLKFSGAKSDYRPRDSERPRHRESDERNERNVCHVRAGVSGHHDRGPDDGRGDDQGER
jgi:hypothetical protein